MLGSHEIRTTLYKALNWTYISDGQPLDFVQNLIKWRMLSPKLLGLEYNGMLAGLGYDGQAFRIVNFSDVKPTPLSADDSTQSYNEDSYVLVSFRQPKTYQGRTIIVEDKGIYNPTTIDLMQRVAFVCETFEQDFEVYSDNKDEAEMLITSGLIEKMKIFRRELLGQTIQACIWDNEIHFLLKTGNLLKFSDQLEANSFAIAKRAIIVEAGTICTLLEQLFCLQASLGTPDTKEAKQKRLNYYEKCLLKMVNQAKTMDDGASGHDTVRRKAS